MLLLVAVSLLWAFSFGLIKGRLGGLDSAFVSAARLGLALLVFLPFFRWRGLRAGITAQLAALGAVQFGVMYLAYNESFRHLAAHEVALFTLTTPMFVTLLADAVERRFRATALAAAALAVAGTAVVVFSGAPLAPTLHGLALVQLSNAAFAAGQVWYRELRRRETALRDAEIFALPYLGGFALAALVALLRVDFATLQVTREQWLTLAYLGVLASGAGFFLWNLGVTRVSAATAAVMNNAKIPLGIACAVVFFGESVNLPRLLLSLALLGAAIWLAERKA
jgi:drug/metabolite transporter (DMT)-like permease